MSINETTAYLAGFIASDGHMQHKKLEIEINSRDSEILLRLQKEFPKAAIRSRTRTVEWPGHTYISNTTIFCIGNVKFIAMLTDKFGIPLGNKSKTVKFPVLDESLEHHYVRGLIDGDGSLGFTATGRPFLSLITCSSDLAAGYCDFLCRRLSIIKTTSPNKRDGAHNIMITCDSARDLAKLLYLDAPISMHRKQEKANKLIAWVRPPQQRKASHPRVWFAEQDAIVLSKTIAEACEILGRTEKSIKMRKWRLSH